MGARDEESQRERAGVLVSRSKLSVRLSATVITLREHTVVLPENVEAEPVYLGVDRGSNNSIIIGLEGDFTTEADPRIPIWEFYTNSDQVTAPITLRPLGPENAESDLYYDRMEAEQTFLTPADGDDRYVETSGDDLEADLDFAQHAALNRVVERRTDRPSNPVPGQEWMRTDVEPRRIEYYTELGYRQVELSSINLPIEHFSHNDSTAWNSDGGGVWEIQSDISYEGTYAARATGTKRVWTHPNENGLENYPKRGDHWGFYYHPVDMAGQSRTRYGRTDHGGFADEESYLEVQTFEDGTFRLRERLYENGSATTETIAATYDIDWTLGAGYWIDIWWDHHETSAQHRAELTHVDNGNQLAAVEGDASHYDPDTGGMLLYVNSGGEIIWDGFQIPDRT